VEDLNKIRARAVKLMLGLVKKEIGKSRAVKFKAIKMAT